MTLSLRLFHLEQEIIAVGNGRLQGAITQQEWAERSSLLLRLMARLRPTGRDG
jgi:hypothetical protein